MGRGFVAVFALTVTVLGAASARAGEGLSKFSVDSEAPKAAVAKTPEGIECPLGIAQVKALDGERFEYGGKAYKMRDLAKALRKANKAKTFDCVVIEGGKAPGADGMKRIAKDLSDAPVKHVEWGGTRPDTIQKPAK